MRDNRCPAPSAPDRFRGRRPPARLREDGSPTDRERRAARGADRKRNTCSGPGRRGRARQVAGNGRVTLRACTSCGRIKQHRQRCAYCPPPTSYRGAQYQQARAQTLREEHTCWICGDPARPGDPLTADHLVPVSKQGSSERHNLRAAHRSCNGRRGAQGGRSPREGQLANHVTPPLFRE